jgi:hypothetical protein
LLRKKPTTPPLPWGRGRREAAGEGASPHSHPLRNSFFLLLSCLLFFLLAPAASAAEITSNGTGGGKWDDTATWRGKVVPAPGDEVVIAKDDTVVFERNDDGKISCKQLFLDPRSKLTFKTGGKRILCVDGVVESHGTIQLDATSSADDHFELRLVAAKNEDREIRLRKGANLTLLGKPKLADGKRNVIVTSMPPPVKPGMATPPVGNLVNKDQGVSIEFQNTRFDELSIYLTGIDNTGSKPGERANINGCRFGGRARVTFNGCDTGTVTNCVFDETEGGYGASPYAAVHLYGSPLTEVKNNVFRGRTYGVMGQAQNESVVVGCVFEKCSAGVYWFGTNGMLKDLTIRECDTGLITTSMSGSLEDITIEKCKVGYNHAGATVQATNLVIKDVPKDCKVIEYSSGPLVLLNCPIKPEDVKMNLQALASVKPDYTPVEWWYFVVADVKGKVPEDSFVSAKTVGVTIAAGADDPNVRNSPAPIVKGRTPLPKTVQALTVRGQKIDVAGKIHAAPSYTLGVYAPPEKEGSPPKLLKSATVMPLADWYRPKPDAPTSTTEITLP